MLQSGSGRHSIALEDVKVLHSPVVINQMVKTKDLMVLYTGIISNKLVDRFTESGLTVYKKER